jgi:hypothetical protein
MSSLINASFRMLVRKVAILQSQQNIHKRNWDRQDKSDIPRRTLARVPVWVATNLASRHY